MVNEKLTYDELIQENEKLRQTLVFHDNINENVFRKLAENMNDVFWIRTDRELIYLNSAFEKIWGISCEEIYKNPHLFFDTIHPDDKAGIQKILDSESFRKSGPFNYDYRIIRPDKQIRWINTMSLPVVNDKGEITRLVGVSRDVTDQKMSQENTSLLAEMLDIAPNSITVHNENGEFLYANQKTFEIHGYSAEEFMSINLHELDVPESAALIQERMNKIIESGHSFFEVDHYKKDKTIISLEVFVKSVNWKGSPALLSIATDITERKKVELQAQNNESRYKKAEQIAHFGSWEMEIKTGNCYWSDEFFRICGYEPGSLIPTTETGFNLIHPEDREKASKAVEESISTGKPYRIEKRIVRPDEEVRWILSEGEIVYNKENQPEKLIGSFLDITENKIAKEKLKYSEEKYKAAFFTSPDSVNLNKLNGEFVEINEGFTRLTGYTEKEVIGKLSSEIEIWSIPEDREKLISGLKKDGIVENLESLFRAKNGTLIPGLMSAKIIHLNNEPHILSVTREITERKKMESELIESKEKAEEGNRLKTEFLNNLSHEIRTPMNGIMGFSELLDKPNLTVEKRRYFSKIIQNSSLQLLKIIDDILEISSLETKQLKLNEESFCLNDMLTELHSIFNLKSKEQSVPIYLKKGLNDYQSNISSDRAKLARIMGNLLENALKFTYEGFIEFGYYLEKNSLVLYVKDTGIGISPKNKEIIFERFSQEDKELSRKQGGLGLGLSISKENAQLLGGDIFLESEKGKGSTFYVRVPFKPVNLDQQTNEIESMDMHKGDNNKFTILVAEDEKVNYLYIEAVFGTETSFEYDLLHAKDGKEAVDICSENEKIDIVLMDIKMPVMNGHEATEKIKLLRPNLPVIAQSAYSTESDRQLAIKHGCDDFIVKPINRIKLIDIVHKYLKKYGNTDVSG